MATLTIGNRVRDERERRDITREVLARRAGVSVATLVRLELHNRLPHVVRLAAIARQLDIDIDLQDLEGSDRQVKTDA